VRAAAELLGKLSSLALLALLARRTGAAGLGVFVFAIAWAQVAAVLIGPGLDRLLLRREARRSTARCPTSRR
jgi:O-antigen/teichoic acid export membrane protein